MRVTALTAIFTDRKDEKIYIDSFTSLSSSSYTAALVDRRQTGLAPAGRRSLRAALSVQYRRHLSRNAEVEVMQVLKPFYRGGN